LRLSFWGFLVSGLLLIGGCSEDDEITGDDWVRVTIGVLSNNTDTRVTGAQIVIDDNENDFSCYTSDPDGECTFALSKGEHSIMIFKTGYSRLNTTFRVTTDIHYKYFSLFSY
jgi:hypothetical protein